MIPPGESLPVVYAISVTNMDGQPKQVNGVTDFLPPGFTIDPGTMVLDSVPATFIEDYPDLNIQPEEIWPADDLTLVSTTLINFGTEEEPLWRWEIEWVPDSSVQTIASGARAFILLTATTTQYVSGNYYNEVFVLPNPTALSDIFGSPQPTDTRITTLAQYYESYSWNSGVVMVPSYDANASVNGDDVDANLALNFDSITITSFQIR